VSGLPRARHAVHVAVRLAQLVAARFAERVVPSLRLVSLEEAVATFCDAVEHQIHLLNEAAHNRRFRANFQDEPDLHFPLLFEDACSDEVLTMEFVEGLREEELEASSVDVRHVVMAGMRCVCRMIFSHGFVHADLHPGNMRFESNGRIVLFDLGLVGELSDKDRLTNAQLLFSFATGDGKTVARSFYENSPHTATPDYDAYEREICAFALRLRLLGLGNVQLALEIGRIFDILRRHHIQARSHMTMVNLALATAEGLGKRLAPDLSLADEALPYLAEALGIPAPPRANAG
jgi:ubiquinone biosynthesis protein